MNVAARLQSGAEPGTIVIGGATARKLQGRFLMAPLGHLAVRGRQGPVEAWRLLSARPDRPRSEPAGLVGRTLETAELTKAAAALRAGRGGLVLVEGEPGIGKTRLLEWLRDELGEDATWVEGHCASYGGQPLCHAPAEALRGWVGVEDVVRRGATLERLGLEPDALPYLASLISVDDGEESLPAQFDAGLGGAYEAWLRGLAREQPVVLAMHDLHWADHCTLALVERLLKLIDDLPLLIAATSRPAPDGSDRRFLAHARLEHGERVVELRLGALGDSEAGELLSQLAPGELAPEASSELIAVAEGNPLYLEQLLRSLLESGGLEARRTWALTSAPTAQLPIGLESLLVARIAALPRDARAVAQAAAVLGRTFAPTVLGFVSGVDDAEQNLTRLLRANIIQERRAIPNREYAFTHGLLQKAALSTLTRARRRELYRLVAAAHRAGVLGLARRPPGAARLLPRPGRRISARARVPRASREPGHVPRRADTGRRPLDACRGPGREGGGSSRPSAHRATARRTERLSGPHPAGSSPRTVAILGSPHFRQFEMGAPRPFFLRGRSCRISTRRNGLCTARSPRASSAACPESRSWRVELTGPERITVFVDHPQGVDHALCERVTEALRGYLERVRDRRLVARHRAAASAPPALRARRRPDGRPSARADRKRVRGRARRRR